MWDVFRKAPSAVIAEMWKELFEGEGVPCRIMPEKPGTGEVGTYLVLVPRARKKVVEEILRKI
ncbi:MAG: hypothetical protein Q8O76_13950 [Chloroflexota bacterium]|nr:hypothetical protein [Chloroflexota bacterium]